MTVDFKSYAKVITLVKRSDYFITDYPQVSLTLCQLLDFSKDVGQSSVYQPMIFQVRSIVLCNTCTDESVVWGTCIMGSLYFPVGFILYYGVIVNSSPGDMMVLKHRVILKEPKC